MSEKARTFAFTKLDTVTKLESIIKFQKKIESSGEKVFRITSISGEGIQELLHYLAKNVNKDQYRNYRKIIINVCVTVVSLSLHIY